MSLLKRYLKINLLRFIKFETKEITFYFIIILNISN